MKDDYSEFSVDASIIIDLEKSGLIDCFFKLPYVFRCPRPLIEKETATFSRIIKKNNPQNLVLDDFDNKEMRLIYKIEMRGRSIYDKMVYFIAEQRNIVILTGDNDIRKKAKINSIEVHGIIFVYDLLVKHNLIEPVIAKEKLVLLQNCRSYLPEVECKKYIEKWNKMCK